MDISVSRLNNRMALQVPAELPLGLVFITGEVQGLAMPAVASEQQPVSFELVEEGHRLPCHVPRSVVEETQVQAGDRIRVSGHLVFEPRAVHYYLSARDLEVLPQVVGPTQVSAVPIAPPRLGQGVQSTSLAQSELPPWVKKLAPREIQEELGMVEEPQIEEVPVTLPQQRIPGRERRRELPPEMLDFLSSAIDSDQEIELTRDMIREYLPAGETDQGRQTTAETDSEPGERTAAPARDEKRAQQPPRRERASAPFVPERRVPARPPRSTPGGAVQKAVTGDWQRSALLAFLLLLMFLLAFLLIIFFWEGLTLGAGGSFSLIGV